MASNGPKILTPISKLRHWKQRYDPSAKFVWRKETKWAAARGKRLITYPAGSLVPEYIIEAMGRAKLRRFWESHRIELYEFSDPHVRTGRVDPADPLQVKQAPPTTASGRNAAARKKKAAAKKAAAHKKKAAKGNGAAKKKAAKRKPLSPEKKAEAQAKRTATIARKKAEADAAKAADSGEE